MAYKKDKSEEGDRYAAFYDDDDVHTDDELYKEESFNKNSLIVKSITVLLLFGIFTGVIYIGTLGYNIFYGDEYRLVKKSEWKEKKEVASTFLEVPTMIVNLNTDDDTPRYLRLSLQLELLDKNDKEAVTAIIPKITDGFQVYLRELRLKDLRGSAGIYRLQTELLWRVNQAASPIKIRDVLFQEILVQ